MAIQNGDNCVSGGTFLNRWKDSKKGGDIDNTRSGRQSTVICSKAKKQVDQRFRDNWSPIINETAV
jgi:hypothetical protein